MDEQATIQTTGLPSLVYECKQCEVLALPLPSLAVLAMLVKVIDEHDVAVYIANL